MDAPYRQTLRLAKDAGATQFGVVIEGNWKKFKGKAKSKCGKLTDAQLDDAAGKRHQLSGKIQEAYGVSKDEADEQIRQFEQNASDKDD